MPNAHLLVSHGSRDPRPEIAMRQLAEIIIHKQENLVSVAYLEVVPEPLHEQIIKFAESALALGYHHIKIIPLFLLSGVHVMTDIPAEVALAQQSVGQDMIIDLQPYLGSHPNLKAFLAKQMATIKAETWILLSHGSRRPGSQQAVEAMATSLGAVAAYWAIAPSLESKVKELVAGGKREIAILPYFLFAGGITDAIAQTIEELKLQFPMVTFHLAKPLGASAELADLIWDLMYR